MVNLLKPELCFLVNLVPYQSKCWLISVLEAIFVMLVE